MTDAMTIKERGGNSDFQDFIFIMENSTIPPEKHLQLSAASSTTLFLLFYGSIIMITASNVDHHDL
uniref:Uncharacterized protein n=1 Tax=Romanomermis culicivorax TaxID=13658 RepID=A0A915HGV5_ROMCU